MPENKYLNDQRPVLEIIEEQGNESFSKRRGQIRVSKSFLDGARPEFLVLLFERFFPLYVDHRELYVHQDLIYQGFSPHFENDPATVLPSYEFFFRSVEQEGEPTKYLFDKVERIEPI